MHPILGCCGYRCDLCPAYRKNLGGWAEQQHVRAGWLKYHGVDLPAERVACDGCGDRGAQAVRVDETCPVRACAMARGFPTCAACPDFGCSALRSRRVTREGVESRCGALPPDDVVDFVLPYLGWARLERMRAEAAAADAEEAGGGSRD